MIDAKNNGGKGIQRSAFEIKKYRVLMKVLPITVGVLTIVTVVTYVCAVMYSKFGSFTVSINKFDNIDYALSLSETPDFNTPTVRLNSKASENVTNISIDDLPLDLDDINGVHNGENYVAYTFYLKNTGKKVLDYEYYVYIANATLNIEKAVRVRLYVNGEYRDYARTATDGSGPEPGTVEFKTNTTIVREQMHGFNPGDITKFTVVIWLEGDDPDCTDGILGGQFKMDMSMSVLSASDVSAE